MQPTSKNPYSAGAFVDERESRSPLSLVASVAAVAVVTTIASFLAYVIVGFAVETVLILGFGRWEPLSAIVPHSDLAMVYVSAFVAGLAVVRLKRITVPYYAVPIGATLVWGTAGILNRSPWWLVLGLAISTGCVTLFGYMTARVIVDSIRKPVTPAQSADVSR